MAKGGEIGMDEVGGWKRRNFQGCRVDLHMENISSWLRGEKPIERSVSTTEDGRANEYITGNPR